MEGERNDGGLEEDATPRRGPWRQAAARFWRRPLGVAALAVVALFFLVALLAPLIAPYAVGQISLELIQHPQSPLAAHHLLGTDVLGHDYLTQMLFAVRGTMLSAFLCVLLAVPAGAVIGLLAGYFRGPFETASSFVMQVVVAVPAIAVLGFVSTRYKFLLTPFQNALWLALLFWPSVSRVVAASVGSLQHSEFVEAAHASGGSTTRILFRHLLPNVSGPIVVVATWIVAQAIVVVATVQYLGYSFNEAHQPTLGGLVADGTNAPAMILSGSVGLDAVWWLYVLPTVALVVLLLSVTFLGDALDEALNPASA
jgi:peptide/nickel transport system permease protein